MRTLVKVTSIMSTFPLTPSLLPHSQVRRVISDFAVFIAVIVWVVVDILAKVDTPKLDVPNVFDEGLFALPNRTFIINPVGMSSTVAVFTL